MFIKSLCNSLLTEMDGFESEMRVVVIAATNRPEALDQVLCRPGCFSRKVFVGEPDLANIVNESALLAARRERTYKKTPRDAENLTQWAVALLRLSMHQSFPESLHTVEVSVSKLLEAFPLNPKNADVLWLLGMAFTKQALLTPDDNDAKLFFDTAAAYFKRASRQDPSHPSYKFSSELADVKFYEQTRWPSSAIMIRLPEWPSSVKKALEGKHAKIHTHGLIQQSSRAISCFKGPKTKIQ